VMVHALELSNTAQEAELTTSLPSVSRITAQERLNKLAIGVSRLGLDVEAHLEDGFPPEVVLGAVRRFGADLLVLGTHGIHRGLTHLLIGSNTEKMLLASACPTLTVGAHVLAGVDLHLHMSEIVYFSDFTPEAAAAAPYALFYGREFGVPVNVCHLLPAAPELDETSRGKMAQAYCESLKQALGSSDSAWCRPTFQLDRGLELEQIFERARREHTGMIVLGVRMQSQLSRHLNTSFAYRLLAEATCPVLTIRQD